MGRKTEKVQEQEQFDFSIFDKYTIADIMKYYAEYRNRRYLKTIEDNEEYHNNIIKEMYKFDSIKKSLQKNVDRESKEVE